MKIAMPVSSAGEMEMLLACGADECYCGIRLPDWERRFGRASWVNRRSPEGANLGSREELAQVAQAAHGAGAAVHLTLNAPFYSDDGIAFLLELLEGLCAEGWIDAVIVSDINLILRLDQAQLPLDVHLSSLGACTNSFAVDFYRSIGVRRIILPRQMALAEMEGIVTRNRRHMAFEVFALNDGCFFEEGFCQTLHALGGPICLTPWEVAPRGEPVAPEALAASLDRLREYQWYQNNCGSSFQQDGFPNGPCSLCRFGHFRDWGVAAVKVVGREASFFRKMRSLQLAKAVMDRARRGAPPDAVAAFARELRATPVHCDKGYMCYCR